MRQTQTPPPGAALVAWRQSHPVALVTGTSTGYMLHRVVDEEELPPVFGDTQFRTRHDAGDAACGRATERCVAATDFLTELVVDMIHFFATLGEEYDEGTFFADDDAWTFQRIRIFDASFT